MIAPWLMSLFTMMPEYAANHTRVHLLLLNVNVVVMDR